MSAINPVLPQDGDPGWGDVLNAAIRQIVSQSNAQDATIASINSLSAPPPATASSQGVIQLAGDLNGTASAPTLKAVLTPGSAGNATTIPVITWDAKGRLVSVTTTTAALNPITDNGDGTWSAIGTPVISYTKAGNDSLLAAKAPLVSPLFSGTVGGIDSSVAALVSDPNSLTHAAILSLIVGGPATISTTDNGNGTFTTTGTGIVDNGNGTFTASGSAVVDNSNGTYTLTA